MPNNIGAYQTLTEQQKIVIRCAVADLIGALQAKQQWDYNIHDWKGHKETIKEMYEAFEELANLDPLPTNVHLD